MDEYEVIAFYKEHVDELSAHAEWLKNRLNVNLRYEKIPVRRKAMRSLCYDNTVFALFNRDTMGFGKLLKFVYEIPKPVLLVGNSDALKAYENLKLPVGYLMENKEKVVWANFLQKRNPATGLELLLPTEKDGNIREMIDSNAMYIEKVLKSSHSCYTKTSLDIGFEKMLEHLFKTTEEGVLLVMRPFRIFSFFIPLNLRRYRRYAKTQVLLIPRNDDIYVPCH